jgi:hypothetical protein
MVEPFHFYGDILSGIFLCELLLMYICFPGFIVQLRGLDDHSLHPGITLGDIGGTFRSRAAWIMVSCALTMCATQKKKC